MLRSDLRFFSCDLRKDRLTNNITNTDKFDDTVYPSADLGGSFQQKVYSWFYTHMMHILLSGPTEFSGPCYYISSKLWNIINDLPFLIQNVESKNREKRRIFLFLILNSKPWYILSRGLSSLFQLRQNYVVRKKGEKDRNTKSFCYIFLREISHHLISTEIVLFSPLFSCLAWIDFSTI